MGQKDTFVNVWQSVGAAETVPFLLSFIIRHALEHTYKAINRSNRADVRVGQVLCTGNGSMLFIEDIQTDGKLSISRMMLDWPVGFIGGECFAYSLHGGTRHWREKYSEVKPKH